MGRKHPLAEHFGFALLGPLRYRVRSGHVRFSVHAKILEDFVTPIRNAAEAVREKPWLRDQSADQAAHPAAGGAVKVIAKRADSMLEDDSDSSSDEDGVHIGLRLGRSSERKRELAGQRVRDFYVAPEDEPDSPRPMRNVKRSIIELDDDEDDENQSGVGAVIRDVAEGARTLLNDRMCEATDGQVVIAAVVGAWRRVEILTRRLISAPSMPEKVEREVQAGGTLIAPAVFNEIEQAWQSEVHEAVVHLTEEDEGQILQLVVFHVGLSAAFDQAFEGLNAQAGKMETVAENDLENNRSKELGTVQAPARWVLAEYLVEGAALMPFDEDEMERPIEEETESEKTDAMLKQLMHHFDKMNHIQQEYGAVKPPGASSNPTASKMKVTDTLKKAKFEERRASGEGQ